MNAKEILVMQRLDELVKDQPIPFFDSYLIYNGSYKMIAPINGGDCYDPMFESYGDTLEKAFYKFMLDLTVECHYQWHETHECGKYMSAEEIVEVQEWAKRWGIDLDIDFDSYKDEKWNKAKEKLPETFGFLLEVTK